MNYRPYWIKRVEDAWKTRSVVWLSGVRRVGKTSLAKMVPGAICYGCDLLSTVRLLEDPEMFFQAQQPGSRIVLDEIHRLADPSNVLKVAADHYPGLRILATGSSTLAATRKFRDSLTGRKWPVHLCPVLWSEGSDVFGVRDLNKRLLHGGLPEPLLAKTKEPAFFAEWMDAYYARDILELFAVRGRSGFMTLLQLLLRQSGGLADISKLASESGLSRLTAKTYLEAMAISHTIFPLRPFYGGGRREIVARPKIYAFDTGFVTYARGWDSLRAEDRGLLWEHLVLDSLRAAGLENRLAYWRDKSGREIDFIIRHNRDRVDAVECKFNPDRFDVQLFRHFRSLYPQGANLIISPIATDKYARRIGEIEIRFMSPRHVLQAVDSAGTADEPKLEK